LSREEEAFMDTQNQPVCAAIDIGSNTIRMVVAHCWSTTLDVLATDEAVVRLSESVNTNGMISQEKYDQTIAVLRRLKYPAEEYGAYPLLAVATEAVRRATNKDAFQDLQIKHFPPFWIATGGSANSLLLLAQRAFGLSTEHQILSRESVIRCEELLFSLPVEEMAHRYQLEAKRVRILHAGVAIVHALMECFELDKFRISPQDIREGILLAYARFGEDWLLEAQRTTMAREQSNSSYQ
jgi:exopolyphosphatase/pppGpp-phosphohydrolase